jgi:hypothetical protein
MNVRFHTLQRFLDVKEGQAMRSQLVAVLMMIALESMHASAGAELSTQDPMTRPRASVGEHTPLQGRGGMVGRLRGNPRYTRTISGTPLTGGVGTAYSLQYSGACKDRALGTWAPIDLSMSSPRTPDMLSPRALAPWAPFSATKTDTTPSEGCTRANECDAYGCTPGPDVQPVAWNVVDATVTPATQRPSTIYGNRSLWCGTFDQRSVGTGTFVGYRNNTFQVLYIDTGDHTGWPATFVLRFALNFSVARDDAVYLIGGGGNAEDPIGGGLDVLKQITQGQTVLPYEALVLWSGNMRTTTTGISSVNTTTGPLPKPITDENSLGPQTLTTNITINSQHRSLYLVLTSNNSKSSEDGLWPFGRGLVFDSLRVVSPANLIFNEETAPGGVLDNYGGVVLKPIACTTPCAHPILSGRSPISPCIGEVSLMAGSSLPTADFCSPDKALPTDSMWTVADPSTHQTSANVSLEACTFPVPAGTASLIATWNQYLDMPQNSGYVQLAEYRFFKGGNWSQWRNTSPSGTLRTGANQYWIQEADELTEAVQADSVQLRYSIRCLPELTSPPGQDCMPVTYGVLYDDLGLYGINGAPAPVFGIFPASLPQTTFVSGSIGGAGCSPSSVSAGVCWPGPRGSDQPSDPALPNLSIHDNVNSPLGDSIVISILTPLRQSGMGLNWRFGYDKTVSGGMTIAHTNASYKPFFDVPRIIYRLFDPSSKTWSPFDSSALDADAVVIGPQSDTTLAGNGFRMVWPPRDKVGANLPGGFTINGKAAYSQLAFLPRGTRLQYYFKAVDTQGGIAYQFQSDDAPYEVQDLPLLPGSSVQAPDILEFDVLPRAYAAGAPGSLLAGKTTTPLLNVDGAYGTWSYALDPMTQALRGLGVRADRYRLLEGVGYENNIGGGGVVPSGPRRNYFPNFSEYPIAESLSVWYRIIILSGHSRTGTWLEEPDAGVLNPWLTAANTGTDGGDRCIFASGDNFYQSLLSGGGYKNQLALNFGVQNVSPAWDGTTSNPHPMMDDRFAGGGPGLASPGTFTYPADGGCPVPNRFDVLTPTPGALSPIVYPGSAQVAAVALSFEGDPVADKDRTKTLGYAYSFQFIRQSGLSPGAPNYPHSGFENRMRVLYKFLTSCRGPRTGAASDTGKCWPCPGSSADLTANWAAATGFQTGTYGPLYAIQDHTTVTGIEAPATAPGFNQLFQNRPNPFNPQTAIPFALSRPGRVVIRIYDVLGRTVRTLLDADQPAGFHIISWDGRLDSGMAAASGIYLYRITYPDGHTASKKMSVLR